MANTEDTTTTVDAESSMEDALLDLFRGDDDHLLTAVGRVRTFDSAGVMTTNRGLVVQLTDGSEFQLTVVQSKPGR